MSLEATESSAEHNKGSKNYLYFSLFLIVLFIGLAWYISGYTLNPTFTAKILIGAALLIAALLLIKPVLLRKLYTLWIAFGRVLQTINTFILLGVIFYVLVIPIGFLYRVFSGNRSEKKKASFWVKPETLTIDLRKQF